jgi:hypothetical protein
MLDITQIFDGTPASGQTPSAGVAITATRVSTNVLDLLTGRDIGSANPLAIHVDVLTTFTAAGAATLQIDYEVCDTVGGTYLSILSSPIIPVAQLVAGTSIFRYPVPVNQVLNAAAGVLKTPGRFVRLNYVVATGPFTAGSVMAYLNPLLDRDQYVSYPANYTAAVAAGEI